MNNHSEKIRTFIAITLPEATITQLETAISALKKQSENAKIKWVPFNNLHITLRFLGSTSLEQLPQITERLRHLVLRQSPFELELAGLGFLPNKKHARVITIDVNGNEILQQLANAIEIAMVEVGFEPEQRNYHPHLTIARVKQQDLPYLELELEPIVMTVNNIHLMQSVSTENGVRYDVVECFDFPLPSL